MFWRENWHWLLALIVVISIGGFILFKPKTLVTVKKVYKVPDFSQIRKDKTIKDDETQQNKPLQRTWKLQWKNHRIPQTILPKYKLNLLGRKSP